MATTVGFNRKIANARDFEREALRDIGSMVFPFTPVRSLRAGSLSAHYLEASTKGDTSKLAVLFHTGPFVEIAYLAVGSIYAYGGYIVTENLESITISDRVTEGFYELEVVIGGEALTLVFDPAQNAYAPAYSARVSDAALGAFGVRKAA